MSIEFIVTLSNTENMSCFRFDFFIMCLDDDCVQLCILQLCILLSLKCMFTYLAL